MKYLITPIICLLSMSLSAQVQTPQASTSAKIEQVVGLTSIEISYARPTTRGRTIFGDLVPFDKMWRTGANKNTSISFSDPVQIEGIPVKAGTYAIYSKPGMSTWTIYLYADTENWGLPQKWNEDLVVAEFKTKSQKNTQLVENFTIQMKDINSSSAKLEMAWENTYVEFSIEVPTDKKVMKSIDETFKAEAEARDYYNAAVYFFEEGKDINQSLKWIDLAMRMQKEKPFWMLRQQALIYHKAGKHKEAIQLAEDSMKAAKKAGNEDYVKMNEKSIDEWKQ